MNLPTVLAGYMIVIWSVICDVPVMQTGKMENGYTVTLMVIVLLVAAYFRFVAVNSTQIHNPVRADAAEYLSYAYNLRHHGTYSLNLDSQIPDAKRSPGYPIFLMLFSSSLPGDNNLSAITITQALLSVLTVLTSYLLFRRVLSPILALFTAFLVANSPHLISANTLVLTESLFTFVLSAFILLASNRSSYERILSLFAIGVLLAVLVLIRPTMQFFFVPLAAYLVYQFGVNRGLQKVGIMFISMLLLYSPWAIRNIHSFGAVSDPTLKIAFVHHGMYPNFKYRTNESSYGFPYVADPESARISKSTEDILSEVKRRFIEEPFRHTFWFVFKKPFALWSWNLVNAYGDVFVYPIVETPYESSWVFKMQHIVMKIIHWPLMLLGLVGCVLVWIPKRTANMTADALFCSRIVSLLLLYYISIHMVGAPFPRYSVPLRPFIYCMALLAGAILWQAYASKITSKITSKLI